MKFQPDTVFHLAWYGVGNRYRNAEAQIGNNLQSSLSLLRMAIDSGCQTWVGLGSQAEYGLYNTAIEEGSPTNPTTLYGATKLCTYLLTKQLTCEQDMRFAWLRLFSSYGPKDNREWMIPYVIQALQRGDKPSLTAGEQKWDYLYVEDVATALFQVADCHKAHGVFNLGSGQAQTLRGIVETIRDLIDPSLTLGFGDVPYRSDQVMHLQANITKLCEVTGWMPQTTLEDGLRKTVEWFKKEDGSRE